MNADGHTDKFAGLNTLDPATTPATDSGYFQQAGDANANLVQAEGDLRDVVSSAREA